jgi:hypothetical protein
MQKAEFLNLKATTWFVEARSRMCIYFHCIHMSYQLFFSWHEIENYFPSFLFSVSNENSLRKMWYFVVKLSSFQWRYSNREGCHFALLGSPFDRNTSIFLVVLNSIDIYL